MRRPEIAGGNLAGKTRELPVTYNQVAPWIVCDQ
jgi:hypothetical protein